MVTWGIVALLFTWVSSIEGLYTLRNKAITFGKPRLMREDWLGVFDRDEIAESIRRIT